MHISEGGKMQISLKLKRLRANHDQIWNQQFRFYQYLKFYQLPISVMTFQQKTALSPRNYASIFTKYATILKNMQLLCTYAK